MVLTPNVLGRMYGAIDTRQDGATVPVSSEDGFRRALTLLAKKGKPATILITAPFTVKAPITIPVGCTGLTIRSSGRHKIKATGLVDCLFNVYAASVVIENVCTEYAGNVGGQIVNLFDVFVRSNAPAPTSSIVKSAPALLFCEVEAGSFYVEETATNGALLLGNRFQGWGSASDVPVRVSGFHSHIIGNRFSLSGNGLQAGVTIGTGAFRWIVTGNVNEGEVNSAASDGENRLASNVSVNGRAHVLHATDVDADNPTIPAPSWTTVTKATTETRTSDGATLADDDELLFAMAASTTYRVRGSVMIESHSTPDFKYQFNGPAAPTNVTVNFRHAALAAGETVEVANSYANTATTISVGGGANPRCMVTFEAVIENGANAGNFAFQWAQATSDANATIVLKGSYLEYAAVA